MKWFEGNIEDAVVLSKRNKLVFVVGVLGNDELSKNLEECVECDAVKAKLENTNNFVCIKVDPSSQDYMSFAQIYQLVPVPSVFFLGIDGCPIAIITEAKSENEVITVVEKVLLEKDKIEVNVDENPELVDPNTSMYTYPSTSSVSDMSFVNSAVTIADVVDYTPTAHGTVSEMNNVVNKIPNIDIRPNNGDKAVNSSKKAVNSEVGGAGHDNLNQDQSITAENAIMSSINSITNNSVTRSNFRDVNKDFLKSEMEIKTNDSVNMGETSTDNINENLVGFGEEATDEKLNELENLKGASSASALKLNLRNRNSEVTVNVNKNDSNEIENLKNDEESLICEVHCEMVSRVEISKDSIESRITNDEDVDDGNTDDKNKDDENTDDKNKDDGNNVPTKEEILKMTTKSTTQVNFSGDDIKNTTPSNSKQPLDDAVTDVQKALQEENNKKKELLDEVKRARMEDDEAKKQILMKIASDKLERIARYGNTVDIPKNVPQVQTTKQQSLDKKFSRIQFRAPDGQSHTHIFQMDDKFIVIREYVRDNILQNTGVREFTLATNFPRHEFVSEDNDKTILELELYPSPSILIIVNTKPNKAAKVLAESGGFINMLKTIVWSLVNPFYLMIANLGNYFRASKDTNEQNENTNTRPSAVNLDNLRKKSGIINDGASSSDKPKNKTPNTSNIHRLIDSKDSDDEHATWNGNSTQQQ